MAEGRKSRCFRSAFREEFLDVTWDPGWCPKGSSEAGIQPLWACEALTRLPLPRSFPLWLRPSSPHLGPRPRHTQPASPLVQGTPPPCYLSLPAPALLWPAPSKGLQAPLPLLLAFGTKTGISSWLHFSAVPRACLPPACPVWRARGLSPSLRPGHPSPLLEYVCPAA